MSGGPRFDAPVPPGGYAWWYLDALSDCGRYGLTIIGFIGSVFSPYYAWSGRARPANHCAMNVAVYTRGASRWAMTERREAALGQSPTRLQIGPSAMEWDGTALRIHIDERAAPLPHRVRGTVTVRPQAITTQDFALDAQGRHRWHPLAPRARVEVALTAPALSWSGEGYLDSNAGTESLEAGFARWDWSRAHLARDTAILYDGLRRDGSEFGLALRIDPAGRIEQVAPPPLAQLPPTLWRVARATRADMGTTPTILRTFEDSPFYARATLATRLFGERATAVHETLSLDRFARPWVKWMLPFRMPRTLR